jgi:hypothetical protein
VLSTVRERRMAVARGGRRWRRLTYSVIQVPRQLRVRGLARHACDNPVLPAREVHAAGSNSLRLFEWIPPSVGVVAHAVRAAEVIAHRGGDDIAHRRGGRCAFCGAKNVLDANRSIQRIGREGPVGIGDLFRYEGLEVIGVHQDAVGRIQPAVAPDPAHLLENFRAGIVLNDGNPSRRSLANHAP